MARKNVQAWAHPAPQTGFGIARNRCRSPNRSASRSPRRRTPNVSVAQWPPATNVIPRSRASAIAGSDGSPGTNASRPRSAASVSDEAAPPEITPTLRTGSGPNSNARGSRSKARRQRSISSARGSGSGARPTNPTGRPARSPNGPAPSAGPEPVADQRVVADLGRGVERQVIRDERHVGGEQRLEPLAPLGVDNE